MASIRGNMVTESVDIYQLPTADGKLTDAKMEITIGDLHANAMKLLYLLFRHGIASGLDAKEYAELAKIYQALYEVPLAGVLSDDPKITMEKHINRFDELLAKMMIAGDGGLVRLIGDELADRGANDYLVLAVLDKLKNNDVKVEILLSNHGVEFVEVAGMPGGYKPPRLTRSDHADSMKRMQVLIDSGVLAKNKIDALAKDVYKPMLKLISYTLSSDSKNIFIYSHAAIGLATINDLAVKFNVKYKDATAVELAQTIDGINRAFQNKLQVIAEISVDSQDKIKQAWAELYTDDMLMNGYYGDGIDSKTHPLEFLMWNRIYRDLNRCALRNDYKLGWAHGHDPNDVVANITDSAHFHIANLDNGLGKGLFCVNHFGIPIEGKSTSTGAYTVLHTPCGIKPPELSVDEAVSEVVAISEQQKAQPEPDASVPNPLVVDNQQATIAPVSTDAPMATWKKVLIGVAIGLVIGAAVAAALALTILSAGAVLEIALLVGVVVAPAFIGGLTGGLVGGAKAEPEPEQPRYQVIGQPMSAMMIGLGVEHKKDAQLVFAEEQKSEVTETQTSIVINEQEAELEEVLTPKVSGGMK